MLKDYITEDFFKADGTVDIKSVTDSMSDDRLLIKKFNNLDTEDLKSLFHILISNNCHKALGKIFMRLESENDNQHDHFKLLSEIVLKNSFLTNDFRSKYLKNLDHDDSVFLLPFKKFFNESGTSHLEQTKFKFTSELNDLKTDLIEQVKFLNQQELIDKAGEIRQKLEFHFPEMRTEKTSQKGSNVKLQQSKDLTFSKVIERNLSFNLRTKKRIDKKAIEKINKKIKSENKALESMLAAWKSIFENHIDLYITQIEFLSPDSKIHYNEILRSSNDLELWTKVELLLKTERAFEGINFLQSKEKEILDKSTEAVYNYYYYKALFYRQAGMLDEAEKIFKALYEQKQNFRDVNFYLKS